MNDTLVNEMVAQCALTIMRGLEGPASEEGHREADELLVSFVEALGFTELAAAYRAVGAWYA
jgi:hypothetical protein